MNKVGFGILIGGCTVLAIVGIGAACVAGTYNGAVQREETVSEYKGDLSNSIKLAASELTKLQEVVDKSDASYQKIIDAIADARTASTEACTPEEINAAITSINVVMEAYPDWNQSDIYKTQMTAIDKTYGTVKSEKESYNSAVKDYRTYVKKFPNSWFLSMSGYDAKNISYIGSDTSTVDDSWGF